MRFRLEARGRVLELAWWRPDPDPPDNPGPPHHTQQPAVTYADPVAFDPVGFRLTPTLKEEP